MKNYYGGFWARFCAFFIDTILMLAMSGFINMAVGLKFFTLQPQDPAKSLFAGLFGMAASVLYYSILQGMFSGTPGKRAMGLRLVDAKTLEKVSVGQSVGRYLMCFVSAICCGLGYFMVGLHKRKQGWHDRVADTLVVKASMIKKLREDEGILPEKREVKMAA